MMWQKLEIDLNKIDHWKRNSIVKETIGCHENLSAPVFRKIKVNKVFWNEILRSNIIGFFSKLRLIED